jgi:hypothetical protein
VVFLYAPAVVVASGAGVSAVGGAGGGSSPGGGGGNGGLGRIRLSATPAMCSLAGAFTPPLASGCAVTPAPGADGRVYVASFPD